MRDFHMLESLLAQRHSCRAFLNRPVELDELSEWANRGEAFLSGTAAVLSPVGTILRGDQSIVFGDGQPGLNTLRLRESLVAIQSGKSEDKHGWRTTVRS